jgi:hypothetical protein
MTRRILLVQGWFTHDGFNYGGRTGTYYRELIDYLSQKGSVIPFEYSDTEMARCTLTRLRSTIASGAFSDIVGHSMGGALIVQLMREGYNFRRSTVVLCQAHIAPPQLMYLMCGYVQRIPFYRFIKAPVPLIEPSWSLQGNWSILTDIANAVKSVYIHQFVDITMMMTAGDLVDVLSRHDGAVAVVCSSDDDLCPVDATTLLSLARWADCAARRFILMKARHMPTWDTEPREADDVACARRRTLSRWE